MGSRAEFISPDGLRLDGRRPNEIRRIQFHMGLFERADGSCLYEQGNTKVAAMVYGPHEYTRGQPSREQMRDPFIANSHAAIHVRYNVASFGTPGKRKKQGYDRKAAEIVQSVRQTFTSVVFTHLFPNSEIEIYLQVLQADGGILAACINATSLALIDAGIPTRDFLVACSAGCIDGHALVDQNGMEEATGGVDLPVAMLQRTKRISLVQMDSKIALDQFDSVMGSAVEGCSQIYEVLETAVRQRAQALLHSRGLVSVS
eukprot:TRINITY_DN2631_c0_g1_i1.p1 TRINITY_DN2631_c0_g1~~TRINITY_DN2631_c0_g1_i1.p1  ORF type:complete len:269 (-),score=37.55 TRINITY_DN2631_c0_g1_i1:18-794(-)